MNLFNNLVLFAVFFASASQLRAGCGMSSEQTSGLDWNHYPSVKTYVDKQAKEALHGFCSKMIRCDKMLASTGKGSCNLDETIIESAIRPATDLDAVIMSIDTDPLIPIDNKSNLKKTLREAKRLYANVVDSMKRLKEDADPANYKSVVTDYLLDLKAKFQEVESAAGLTLEDVAAQVE